MIILQRINGILLKIEAKMTNPGIIDLQASYKFISTEVSIQADRSHESQS